MEQYQIDCANRAARFLALAAKARERAAFAELAYDLDLADLHTQLASGYSALARDAHKLSRFSGPRVAI